jgi:hypothetical protein
MATVDRVCGVPGCSRPGFWHGCCSLHHWEAFHAYGAGVLREIRRDLAIEDWYAARREDEPDRRIHIAPVPLADRPRGGTRYGLAVLRSQLERVAACPEGDRNNTLARAAYLLGGYVAGGEIEMELATGGLVAAAETCGLPYREAKPVIRRGLLAGAKKPISAPDNR